MTDREKIIEVARTVWSAGDVYIGPGIEQLEAFYRAAQAEAFDRVAEKDAEIERINSSPTIEACRQMIRDKAVIEASVLHAQIAESQAREVKLREALDAVQQVANRSDGIAGWHLNGNIASWDSILPEVDEALTTPADDTTLREMIAKAVDWHVAEIRILKAEIERLNVVKMLRFNNEDCWVFQGDGDDHLESLVCPVAIYPKDLITLIAKAGEVMRERACDKVESEHTWVTREAVSRMIRALPDVTLEDLK